MGIVGAVRPLRGCVPTCTPAALLTDGRAAPKDAQARFGPHQDKRSRHGELVQPRSHVEHRTPVNRACRQKLTGVCDARAMQPQSWAPCRSRVRSRASFTCSDFDRTSFPVPASAFLIVCDQEQRLQNFRPGDAPVPTPHVRKCSIRRLTCHELRYVRCRSRTQESMAARSRQVGRGRRSFSSRKRRVGRTGPSGWPRGHRGHRARRMLRLWNDCPDAIFFLICNNLLRKSFPMIQ